MKFAIVPLFMSLLTLGLSFVLTWQHEAFPAAIAFAMSAIFARVGQQYFADQEGGDRG